MALKMKAWEVSDNSAWASLQEDEHGKLRDGRAAEQRAKRRKRDDAEGGLARGLIRYVALAVDASDAAAEKDLRPDRLVAACRALPAFAADLFAANPFSSVSVIAARDGAASVRSDLSSAARAHTAALQAVAKAGPGGAFSLRATLECCLGVLGATPDYGCREIVLVMSALATRDAGDLGETAERLRRAGVRVHVAHLAAEIRVVRSLADATGGTFAVALDRAHLGRLLKGRVPPPALRAEALNREAAPLVEMGFPSLEMGAVRCAAGTQPGAPPVWTSTTYTCPRCSTRVAALPADCPVCSLPLVSAPHLARSYHHLFPVPPYAEARTEAPCFGCGKAPGPGDESYRCPSGKFFCADCDEFIHTSLHNCPGCAA